MAVYVKSYIENQKALDFHDMKEGRIYRIISVNRFDKLVQKIGSYVFVLGSTDMWHFPNNYSDYRVEEVTEGTTLIVE